MQEQIDFIKSEPFGQFMKQLPGPGASKLLHGVFVDLHPIWKEGVDLERTTGTSSTPITLIGRLPGRYVNGTYDLSPELISDRGSTSVSCITRTLRPSL
jgi:hypothetical protein